VGIGTARGGCRLLVVEPGAEPWTASRLVSRDDWRATATPAPVMQVGTCEAHADASSYTIAARLDAGDVTIILDRPPSPTALPDGVLQPGSRFYESEVVVPFAGAEVRLRRSGGPARTVKGHGYADHSRSTALPGQLASAWLRFRATAPACPALLLLRVPPGGGAARGWSWRGSDGPSPLNAPPGLVEITSARPATAFDLAADLATLHFAPRSTLHRYDPVEEHGLVGRIVSAWIGRDITTTYRATVTGLPGCGETTGILELTRID